jgi:glycosyltransferase involved in cell wall biosynthesis
MTVGVVDERARRSAQPRGALRVLHVIARMPAAGTERQLAGMLRAAHRRLWHATLCVLYSNYALSSEIRADGIPVLELDGRDPLHVTRFRQLRRLVTSGDFDVVHSSLWGANALTRVAALDWNRPAVVASERRVEDFRSRPRRMIDRALRPVTDAYIGNSAAVGAFVQRAHRVGGAAVHVVPNGIDRAVFTPDGRAARATGAPVRLGAVGRLVHQKGFDVLLDALPAVLARRDVELRIAGEGEERAALERRAAGLPVRFVGLLETPAAVAAFLRDLDLFVMPSRYEGLPNAVLEALACGLDVVATDVPGMFAASGDGTPLIPPDDPAALADAITAALTDQRAAPPVSIPSFADVAEAHLRVFEAAAGVASLHVA